MFQLKTFLGRKSAPIPPQKSKCLERLSETLSSDRRAAGEGRSDIELESSRPRKLIKPAGPPVPVVQRPEVQNSAAKVAPAKKAQAPAAGSTTKTQASQASAKVSTKGSSPAASDKAASKKEGLTAGDQAIVIKQPTANTKPSKAQGRKQAAPSTQSSEKTAAEVKGHAKQAQLAAFKVYAKSRSMSVARGKSQEFANAGTQEAWEAWQEGQRAKAAEMEKPLSEKAERLQKLLNTLQHQPISLDNSTVMEDMTVIIKRLSHMLYEADNTNVLPQKAMNYLAAKGLMGGEITFAPTKTK